jgi:hypothetical protein
LYFPRFSPELLADAVIQASQSPAHPAAMRTAGLIRSRDFSWDSHVEKLLFLAHTMAGGHPR